MVTLHILMWLCSALPVVYIGTRSDRAISLLLTFLVMNTYTDSFEEEGALTLLKTSQVAFRLCCGSGSSFKHICFPLVIFPQVLFFV